MNNYTKILSIIGLMALSQTTMAQRSVTLTINTATKYQHIDGFGGCGMSGQWADCYNQTRTNMLWGQGEGQIGLNIMRIRINPTESYWGEYGNPIKWARKVNPNLMVFATPWTPPKKYKTSKTEKYQNEFGTYVWPLVEHSWGGQGSNGGTIIDDSIPAYARSLERYRALMEKKGCPVDIISIQNECDYTPTATTNGVEQASYESCIWSPNQMAKMVKATREVLDPKCKVMGPETFGWGQSKYNTTLASNADAVSSIDVWGNHTYGSNDYSFINTVRNKTGKNMWMTEFLWNYGGSEYKSDFGSSSTYGGEFKYEYRMINSIETALKNGYSAYVYYNMNDDFFASSYGGSSTAFNKRAYVFSHYAHYATGKTRIKSTLSGSYATQLYGGSAYMSESGDTLTIFVCNPTTSKYNMTVYLPFEPCSVKQIATSDAASCRVTDITGNYTAESKKMTLSLATGAFYTFEFIKDNGESKEAVPAVAQKVSGNGNPIMPINYIADPTAIEYNGRLYVYGTNDQQEFDYSDGLQKNTYGKITQLVCLSTADMRNWTFHGTIDVKKAASWIWTSWAPSIVSREEADGKTHFYMYFTNSAAGIGVLTATSPLGPWTDPLGKALINSSTSGLGTLSNIIDPGALVDGDRAYLAFGGGDVNDGCTDQYPGNARIVELGSDMKSLKGDIISIKAPYHFEANEINKIGDKLAFSYCSRWSDPSSACSMRWMMADSINGTWSTKRVWFKNPGQSGYPYGNNHTHIQKFNGKNYVIYHTQALEHANGIDGGYRNLAINNISVNESTYYISTPNINDAGAMVIEENLPKIDCLYQAETFANAAGVKCINDDTTDGNALVTNATKGSWVMMQGVNFTNGVADAKQFLAKIQGTGTIEVRLDSINAASIATLNFNSSSLSDVIADISASDIQGTSHNVYLVFTEAQDAKFDSWMISSLDITGINEVTTNTYHPTPTTQYNLTGQRVGSDYRGVVIRGGKKTIIR